MRRFWGKVVVITGASSGIGEATALDFAKEGAKLVIAGRNKERLRNVGEKCEEAGAEVLEFLGDLADFGNLEKLVIGAVQKYGGIDILVNNAGFGNAKTVEQVDLELYEEIFATNLRAPFFLCKYALPYLKKSKGCIVNVSSCASLVATPGSVPYSMTKAALDHFTRGFSAECAAYGVRVNCINPAVVLTRFAENTGSGEEDMQRRMEKFKDIQPLGVINSHQVSEGIRFLCASEMTTGIALPIDGGLLNARKV